MDNDNVTRTDGSLSFGGLTAMIIGSTIGAGIFTTAGDMASNGAHTGSVLVGWTIAGIGMYMLMRCFFELNKLRPDLTNGIYSYAKEGFGEYVGFNSAWGYWMSALISNVSYITLLFGALGYFFPVFGEGNNGTSVICGSIAVWLIVVLVSKGVQQATLINVVVTICKLIPILVFIVAVLLLGKFELSVFFDNFWGRGDVPLSLQIMSTTSSTVWAFIGVEGAVVLSARARRADDVGKASLTGFLGILALYVTVAVLSMGVMTTEELAQLNNPQMAQILEEVVGPWGATLVNVGVIISILGALLGWTIIAAECPYEAARQGVFTKAFAGSNKHGSPVFALVVTNLLIQAFLLIILVSEASYLAFYTIGSSMIMLPYLLSALYYLQLRKNAYAIVGTVYGIWMIISAGIIQFLITSILYAPGIWVYVKGRREKGLKAFEPFEKRIAVMLLVVASTSIVLMAAGIVDPF
ncbi:MAG: basic amino acid/polyamine antiporter [Bacillota bacterium]|nr:basic amino acid/polyamine antiporter [Bacillota bacterium]